jgi:hypothetical protein
MERKTSYSSGRATRISFEVPCAASVTGQSLSRAPNHDAYLYPGPGSPPARVGVLAPVELSQGRCACVGTLHLVSQDDWRELTVSEILDKGIPPFPEPELPPFTQAAAAAWRVGDYGAAMWLYWDPDDLALPFTHEIEAAKWQEGRWRPLGEGAGAGAPGGLGWRPNGTVEWTATIQVRLKTSTLWVLGGVARDTASEVELAQGETRRTVHPDPQSCCVLVGVEVPPVAAVTVESEHTRTLDHWSGPGG